MTMEVMNYNCGSEHRPVTRADCGQRAVYQSWGPGKYDPRYNQDGKSTLLVLPARIRLGKAYRTTPLRALWQHAPYFHDGSATTLADVVAHYNRVRKLNLTTAQQRELVEYLRSL